MTRVQLWLQAAAEAGAAPTAIDLAQYGAIGTLLVAFLVHSYRGWKRETDRSDRLEAEHRADRARLEAEHRAERERLDAEHRTDRERFEGENRRLHNDIQEKAIPALLASATALTAVTEIIRDQQRERHYARPPRRDGEV